MLNIRVNSSNLNARITRLKRSLSNLSPFFQREGSRLVFDEIRDAFDSEGYGTWAPLSPSYAARKRQERPGKGILRYDDTYFRSATSPGGVGSIHVVSNRSLRIGVRSDAFFGGYPALHEHGTARLPARPVFELVRPRLRPRIVRALTSYFGRETR